VQLSCVTAVVVAEDEVLKRSIVAQGHVRVIEHELDMHRIEVPRAAIPFRIGGFVRRLINRPYAGASPMRRVERELEERYPSGNRLT
jgi:hypothetical protein